MQNNLTPDGKIKTIRCVKATHEDFAKLVNMGKKVMQEIAEMEKKTGTCAEIVIEQFENKNKTEAVYGEDTFDLYCFYIKKDSELKAYKNAYKVLMEEGVDELLLSIEVGPESYNYNFYELCLEN